MSGNQKCKNLAVILVIPYNPLVERGGLQNCTIRFASQLKKDGLNVKVVSIGPSGYRQEIAIEGYRSFWSLVCSLIFTRTDIVHWVEVWPSTLRLWLQHLCSIIMRINNRRVFLSTATLGNLTTRCAGIINKIFLKFSYDGFIVYSYQFVSEFEDNGINQNRVHIVPQAVPLDGHYKVPSDEDISFLRDKLKLPKDKLIYLYMGRLVERKRPIFLLSAWQKACEYIPPAILLLVGESWHHEDSVDLDVVRYLKTNSINSVIKLPQTERPWEYLQAADVLICPSSRDGEPNVILEAMACGTPVLASDVPGINTVVQNNLNGLLFNTDSQDKLIEGIINLSNSTTRKSYSSSALNMVRLKRDIAKISKILSKVYLSN